MLDPTRIDIVLTILNADMKGSEQCGIEASKGNQIIGLIRRTITYMDKKIIIHLLVPSAGRALGPSPARPAARGPGRAST